MLDVIEAPTPTTDPAVDIADPWDVVALDALNALYARKYDDARTRAAELMPSLLAAAARDDHLSVDDVLDEVMAPDYVLDDVTPDCLAAQAMILALAGALAAATRGR
jgi:hypothetical protein